MKRRHFVCLTSAAALARPVLETALHGYSQPFLSPALKSKVAGSGEASSASRRGHAHPLGRPAATAARWHVYRHRYRWHED